MQVVLVKKIGENYKEIDEPIPIAIGFGKNRQEIIEKAKEKLNAEMEEDDLEELFPFASHLIDGDGNYFALEPINVVEELLIGLISIGHF